MAVVQYTAIVNQLRGKLNGSQFNKGRTSHTLQRKASQTKQVRSKQSGARSEFSSVQRSWKELTPSQKSAWQSVATNNPDRDRFGNQVVLSGYNKYIQCQLRSRSAGFVISATPFTGVSPAFAFSSVNASGITFGQEPNGDVTVSGTVSFTTPQTNQGFWIVIYLSYPFSRGITQFYGNYVVMYSFEVELSTTIVFDEVLGGSYPLPAAGSQVEFRFDVFYGFNGVRVQQAFQRVQL